MSASIFLRNGSSIRNAATKTTISINATAAPAQRKGLLVASFFKRGFKFPAKKPLGDVWDDRLWLSF
jgi:hypothetical protein